MTATPDNTAIPDNTVFNPDLLAEKLLDADAGGFQAECTPEEAEAMGAFQEDALEEDEALDGAIEAATAADPS